MLDGSSVLASRSAASDLEINTNMTLSGENDYGLRMHDYFLVSHELLSDITICISFYLNPSDYAADIPNMPIYNTPPLYVHARCDAMQTTAICSSSGPPNWDEDL